MLVFAQGGKPEKTEKNPRKGEPTKLNNKVNPHLSPGQEKIPYIGRSSTDYANARVE